MGELDELIERVRGLSGPSREADAEIDAVLFGGRASHDFTEMSAGARLRRSYGAGTVFLSHNPCDNGGNVLLRHYRKAAEHTASIDAAVALCERVLPPDYGYGFHKSSFQASVFTVPPEKRICAEVWSVRDGLKISSGYSPNNPAIALVLATLEALRAEGGR